ncbi:MAG TPA: response regulator transcription factor [Vicinamibacterales bacterium]|nr:response regulator transcription factor [Vicinamibacterales bacterium]
MTATSTIRVVLAEDHETVREGLRAILSADPQITIVGEAADGTAAVAQTQALHPDVVVMDVTMPGLNGFQATSSIKQCCPDTDVLVLTRHAHESYVHEFMRVGASGYVLKQSRSNELLRAVHTVAGGGHYIDPTLASKVGDLQRPRSQSTSAAATVRGLSPREEQVVRLVALGHSNKEIAAQLNVSVKTIEAHKANAGQKLGLASRADVVRYAHMRGWLNDV